MSTSASSFPAPLSEAPAAPARARVLGREVGATAHRSLDLLVVGASATVASIVLDPDQAAWLAAVGIREGDRLTVLRRAAFGGPLHVRTSSGGEFAIARSLSLAILVRHEP